MIEIKGHKLEIDDIVSELDMIGYVVLKVETLQQKEKVSHLVEEMYPYYNEQPRFITLNY
jgi:hypothetical protein